MLFVAESHNTGDPTPYLEAEGARVRELHQAGVIEMLLMKADMSGVIILLRAADSGAGQDALGTLPLVVNGVTSFELTEVIAPSASGAPAQQAS